VTTIASLAAHFSRALGAGGGRVHLAAHSHHLWPDVTHAAHMQAWEDAARLWDGKWDRVFSDIIPEAQSHVALHLRVEDPSSIAFAPNTHEFVMRLFSALPTNRVARVLTTDSEFHSFARQAARLAEDGSIVVETIATAPYETFQARFTAAAAAGTHDMVFCSHVFFNSGFVVPDLGSLVAAVADPETLVVIDGYHAFMALPVDLSAIAHRAFYLAGGYKYACAGEGACFMACPPNAALRPRNTGWYAAFGALSAAGDGQVAYAQDGSRFMGASFDPSGLYRLCASMRWLENLGLGAAAAHARAHANQSAFLDAVEPACIPGLTRDALAVDGAALQRGNFLAFRSPHAGQLQKKLTASGVITDARADVLRIGFGLYHDPASMPAIASRVVGALT
jgi:selenocysteine lyase/cysteine desulfurase